MALYKEADEIVINKNERIKFVGATVTKTKNPTAWIRRRYTVVCTGVSGQTLTAGTGISIVSNAINNTAPNIVQTLTVTGNQISISGGNTQTLPAAVAATPQTLTVTGNQISISGGNTQTLPAAVAATPQTLTVTGNQISISGGNTQTLPAATPQNLSILGQQLSISGGNSITLPPAVAPPAVNIYNTDGSIPVGTNRKVTLAPNPTSINPTVLEINAERPYNSGATNPQFKINAADYSNPVSSNFVLDVGTPTPYSASLNNDINQIDVLCYGNHLLSRAVVARKITLGAESMPQLPVGSFVSQKRKWINGKEEKVLITTMTLSSVTGTTINSVIFSTNIFPSATFKAHKVTLFDNQDRYLESYYVETVPLNGLYVINALVINPNTMYNQNQTGAQLQAIIYYTE